MNGTPLTLSSDRRATSARFAGSGSIERRHGARFHRCGHTFTRQARVGRRTAVGVGYVKQSDGVSVGLLLFAGQSFTSFLRQPRNHQQGACRIGPPPPGNRVGDQSQQQRE